MVVVHKKISLITTTRDRSDFLIESALSVAIQTYQPLEWIIYLDDDLREYKFAIDFIQKIIPNVHFIGGQKIGRSQALIECHKIAQGDYIGLLDDDDLLDKDCLQMCLEEYPFLFTQHLDIRGNMLIYPLRNISQWKPEMFLQGVSPFHFRLYSKALYESVGGIDPTFDTAMDFDLMAKMALKIMPKQIFYPLYYYRQHYNRISQRQWQSQVKNKRKTIEWVSKYLI